jgi:hypothetical protein
MMYSIAYAFYYRTTTPSSIYIGVSYTRRLYETGVDDLIHGIVASNQLIIDRTRQQILGYEMWDTPTLFLMTASRVVEAVTAT